MSPRFATRGQLESHLVGLLAGHRLVCEVDWEDEVLREVWTLWDSSCAAGYPAMTLVAMVRHGTTHYESNDFWGGSGVATREQHRVGTAVEDALRHFGLETFPQFSLPSERALRFVAVMLAHGGIPAPLAGRFLRDTLYPALRRGEAGSATELVARWRFDPPSFFPRPVRRFLLHGGETAADLLDRLIALAAVPRAEVIAHPERQGLPRHLVDTFLEVPPGEIARAALWPRPTIELDPYGSVGPVLRLPPVGEDVSRAPRWEIDDGSGTVRTVRGSALHDSEPIALPPSGRWIVTGRGESVARSFPFEVFAENPIVCFDERWRYLPDIAGIRAEQIWVLAPANVRVASVEADGLRLLTGEHAVALGGAWAGHHVVGIGLAGVDLLAVFAGEREVIRIPVVRPNVGVEFMGTSVRDVLSVDGEPVLAALPSVSLPPGAAWRLRLDAPGGSVETELTAADARRTIQLASLAQLAVGRHELTIQSERLGGDLRTAFVLVPGLALDTCDAPYRPEIGEVAVRATGAPDVRFFRQEGPTSVTVAAGESRAALLASDHAHHKASLLVSVPRVRWAFRSGTAPLELGQDVLDVEPAAIGAALDAFVVSLDRPGQSVSLELQDASGGRLQVEGTKLTDQAGRATFDLAAFRDTARSRAAGGLRFALYLGLDPLLVARHGAPASAPPPAPDWPILPTLGSRVEGTVCQVRKSAIEVNGGTWRALAYASHLPRPPDSYRLGETVAGVVERIEGFASLRLDLRTFDASRFHRGDVVHGHVTRVYDTDLVIDLGGGTEGRAPADRLPRERPLRSWGTGEHVTGRVVDVHKGAHYVEIGVAPFAADRFTRGMAVSATVRQQTPHGLHLVVGSSVGFVPRDAEPDGPRAPTGSRVEGWVEKVDTRRELVVVTCRPFNEGGLMLDQVLDVTVAAPLEGVVLVNLPDGTTGAVPRGTLPAHLDSPGQPPAGVSLRVKVTGIDPATRRITLSVRAATDTWEFGDEEIEDSPFGALRRIRRTRP